MGKKKRKGTARRILKESRLQDTYWGKKIVAAAKRGSFTESNKEEAEHWPTCACGDRYVRMPYETIDDSQKPKSRGLRSLGAWFSQQVYSDDYDAAAALLVKIENFHTRGKR